VSGPGLETEFLRRTRPAGDEPSTVILLAVVNGALTGVASVYLTTNSVIITMIAAASAIILGVIALLK
jgi:heme A synthase